jgi:hypothetical protein
MKIFELEWINFERNLNKKIGNLLLSTTDGVFFGTLHLLLPVLQLSSLGSGFLFDLFAKTSSDLSESDLVFLEVIKRIVDVGKTGRGSTSKFGLHTVNDNAIGGRFVHLGQSFSGFLGGWSGGVTVGDIDDHLLSVQAPVGHVFSGSHVH